jgi:hypothetical protein
MGKSLQKRREKPSSAPIPVEGVIRDPPVYDAARDTAL